MGVLPGRGGGMAKAIFHGPFNYSSKVSPFGWSIKASPEPQAFPREVINAAVKAGVATIAPRERAKSANSPEQSGG